MDNVMLSMPAPAALTYDDHFIDRSTERAILGYAELAAVRMRAHQHSQQRRWDQLLRLYGDRDRIPEHLLQDFQASRTDVGNYNDAHSVPAATRQDGTIEAKPRKEDIATPVPSWKYGNTDITPGYRISNTRPHQTGGGGWALLMPVMVLLIVLLTRRLLVATKPGLWILDKFRRAYTTVVELGSSEMESYSISLRYNSYTDGLRSSKQRLLRRLERIALGILIVSLLAADRGYLDATMEPTDLKIYGVSIENMRVPGWMLAEWKPDGSNAFTERTCLRCLIV